MIFIVASAILILLGTLDAELGVAPAEAELIPATALEDFFVAFVADFINSESQHKKLKDLSVQPHHVLLHSENIAN